MRTTTAPLLVSLILLLGSAGFAQARQIHFFKVFCDDYPPDAGGDINESVAIDRLTVNGLFANNINEQSWGITTRVLDISGMNATKAGILGNWQKFSQGVAADDTVFVYFSGHGGIADRASGDVLLQTCDSKLMSRTEWAKSINALPCKLKILITDCCSSYMEHGVIEGDDQVQPWKSLYYLLLRHEGFVNITAASPGQTAWGTQAGSFLTVNLFSDMQRYQRWDQVFQEASKRVHDEVVREFRQGGQSEDGAQMPFAYSMAKTLVAPGNAASPSAGDQANDYIIADSSRRKLQRTELEGFGLQQLYFARNEIFGRHGFDFSSPLLQLYFSSRPWYRAQTGLKKPALSEVETYNSALILEVEKAKGGPFVTGKIQLPDQGTDTGAVPDIFSYSSTQSLTRSAVEKLSLKELSIARNEIFARHGYPFESPVLQRYFSRKPDYRRNPAVTSPHFNVVEKHNIWLINKLERIKGGQYAW